MIGLVAQMVTLTCHANARIRGIPHARIWPDHSTTKFAHTVEFIVPKGKDWVTVARNPDEFLDYVVRAKSTRVTIAFDPSGDAHPARTAGLVGGGGTWMMDMLDDEGVTRTWRTREMPDRRGAPDKRIWRKEYGIASITETPPRRAKPPLDGALTALAYALEDIGDFARVHSPEWEPHFARARSAVDGGVAGYHTDLAPAGVLDRDARCALDAAQNAWVFGAMGSWNDQTFENGVRADYEAKTDQLFDAVAACIVAATNSGAPT